jgi:hypothetical protein
MHEETTFGAWLRPQRKALDLTQDALAERGGCSVDVEIFCLPPRWRTGRLRWRWRRSWTTASG